MILTEEYIHKIILDEISQTISSNPTLADVIQSFNKINNSFFNGSLPRCKFNLKLDKKYMGFFSYEGRSNNKLLKPTISVNAMYQYNSNQLDSVVAHEMIHYALASNGIDANCTHGQAFKQMANQMNTALGLNISEIVDTGNMQYGMNQNTTFKPSQQLIAYMNSYANSFNGYAKQIEASLKGSNGITANFLQNLHTFTVSLACALKRCVSKKTLNESSGLQMPDFMSAFVNGYRNWSRKTLNFFDLINYIRDGKFSRNYFDRSGGLMIDNNTPLAELLYAVFPDLEKQYNNVSNKTMNSLNSNQNIRNVFNTVNELINRIESEVNAQNAQNTQNAQGQNP